MEKISRVGMTHFVGPRCRFRRGGNVGGGGQVGVGLPGRSSGISSRASDRVRTKSDVGVGGSGVSDSNRSGAGTSGGGMRGIGVIAPYCASRTGTGESGSTAANSSANFCTSQSAMCRGSRAAANGCGGTASDGSSPDTRPPNVSVAEAGGSSAGLRVAEATTEVGRNAVEGGTIGRGVMSEAPNAEKDLFTNSSPNVRLQRDAIDRHGMGCREHRSIVPSGRPIGIHVNVAVGAVTTFT